MSKNKGDRMSPTRYRSAPAPQARAWQLMPQPHALPAHAPDAEGIAPDDVLLHPKLTLRTAEGNGAFPAFRLLRLAELQKVFHVLQPFF